MKKKRSPKPVVFLQGKRLYLRPLEQGDLQRCQRWINDPDLRQYVLSQWPVSMEHERDWLAGIDRENPRRKLLFAIVLKRGNRHIGNMELGNIDWANRNAETGALIGEADCLNKGYGHEAKELLLEYAFDTLGLHRIGAFVHADNPRSLAYLKRNGYAVEGVERDSIFRHGRWIDCYLVGILEHEWRARRQRK